MSPLYTDNRNKVTFGDILQRALQSEGRTVADVVKPPKLPTAAHTSKPVSKPAGMPAGERMSEYDVIWNQEIFGTLKFAVDGYNLTWSNDEIPGHSFSQLDVQDRPDHINVQIIAEVESGVRCWHVCDGSRMRDCTTGNVPTFQVPVTWKPIDGFEDGNWVPHTRRTDIDNIDLILEDKYGRFIEGQLSITTREGKFFLNFQEIYAGHIVRTSVAIARQLGMRYYKIDNNGHVAIVVPLFEHSAYPGADYLKTWEKIGNQLVKEALKEGRSVRLSEATYAKWPEPVFPKPSKDGNLTGVVLFFNVVIGWGFILGSDGKNYFLHFQDLHREYVPFPGKCYEFHPGTDDRGRPKAFAAKRVS